MRLGAVIVHFKTPDLAKAAVESMRADAASSSLDLDLVMVDNGSTAGDREVLATCGVPVIDPGRNLGYAGGFNLGAQALDAADVLIAMNPDLQVQRGCLAELTRSLSAGVGVAGPRFFWDRPGGFLLPPAERRGRRASLGRFLALRGDRWARKARLAWRRHAQKHWRAKVPLPSHHLSGALLAIDTDAWKRVGPFDEGYRLYFEETDWLARARRLGVSGRYVPGAVAVHRYAQSTPKEPRAQAWFEESHRRFRRLHYGRSFSAGLHAASRWWPGRDGGAEGTGEKAGPRRLEGVRWIEIAASPIGFPAAARPFEDLAAGDGLSPKNLPSGRYFLRAIGEGGRELWVERLDVGASP